MMKAVLLHDPRPAEEHPLSFEEHFPIPEPNPHQIRLKIKTCGVCHTDLHTVEGDIHPPSLPVIPGHQVVGIIDAIGAKAAHILKPGQRVGIPWLYSTCGTCDFCQQGMENLCSQARFTGFDVNGGFAEYMLAEAAYALPLPDNLSDEKAAPLLCAGIIGYRSLRKAEVQPGQRLGLFGFGASAHLTIQIARHWGCEVYVFTRSAQHRRHAEELGAAWVGGAEDTPPKQLDSAITFAPAGYIVPLALDKLRPAGTLAINAIHMSDIPGIAYPQIYGERTLRSVANATYQDGLDFMEIVKQAPLVVTTSSYTLEDVNQALIDLKHSRLNGEAVLQIS